MLFDNAPTDDERIKAYIDAWCDREAKILGLDVASYRKDDEGSKHKVRRAMHDDLYKNLDTLDGKASAFLQAASVMFAVQSFIIQASISTQSRISIFLIFGAVTSSISAALCMNVIHVKWLSSVEIQSSSFETLRRLVKLKNRRTRFYIGSFWLLVLSAVSLVCFFIALASTYGLKIGP